MSDLQLDRAGRRRSPATLPGFLTGRSPRNKGLRYPADPPKVEEIIAVMRAADDGAHGRRLRGLIVILWRIAGRRFESSSPYARKRKPAFAGFRRSEDSLWLGVNYSGYGLWQVGARVPASVPPRPRTTPAIRPRC